MATLIAPANNPQTTNAMNGRLTLEVPTYPNSGCQTRTRDTTNSTCPEPSGSYHSGRAHAGKLHYRELRHEDRNLQQQSAYGLLARKGWPTRYADPLMLKSSIAWCKLRWIDSALFIWLYRRCPRILDAISIVRPETVVRWHRKGIAAHWRWKARSRGGRPRIAQEVRDLMRRMSFENRLWALPRFMGRSLAA